MATASYCIALLAAALLTSGTNATCPTGTTPVTSNDGTKAWCIKEFPTTVTFCDAMQTCHSNGQEMISKPVFDAMRTNAAFSSPPNWWVAMTDSLNERGTMKDGWIWFLDGIVTWSNVTDFDSIEPNNSGGIQDCVTTHTSNTLRDTSCDSLYRTFCYTSDPLVPNLPTNSAKFFTTNIANFMQPDPGCWIKRAGVSSLLDCGHHCLKFGFGDCVGFYWNPVRFECIILPYFDASVPLGFDSIEEKLQWRKFLRSR